MPECKKLIRIAHKLFDQLGPLLRDPLMHGQQRGRHGPVAAGRMHGEGRGDDLQILNLSHARLVGVHALELLLPELGQKRSKHLDRVAEFLKGHAKRVD